MQDELLYEQTAGVVTLTLNRPERMNAMNHTLREALIDAFDRADRDETARAVVVTGAGRAYCAGADLEGGGTIFDMRRRQEAGELPRDGGGRLALRIFAMHKPVIAAINGSAVGIGLTQTLPMDVRIVAESAKLGFVFARRGIATDGCSSWFLPRIVGVGNALEWLATGRVFGAREAHERGLVSQVLPADHVLGEAQRIAAEIAETTSPTAVALIRRLTWSMLDAGHPMEAHRAESRALVARGTSADLREGVAAFLEKRPPRFPDRIADGLPDILPDRVEPTFE